MSFESDMLLSLHGVLTGLYLFGSAVCLVTLRGALAEMLADTRKQKQQ